MIYFVKDYYQLELNEGEKAKLQVEFEEKKKVQAYCKKICDVCSFVCNQEPIDPYLTQKGIEKDKYLDLYQMVIDVLKKPVGAKTVDEKKFLEELSRIYADALKAENYPKIALEKAGLSDELIEGVRNIAIGMRKAIRPRQGQTSDTAWDAVRRSDFKEYSKGIQGAISKEAVLKSLHVGSFTTATKQLGWLKEWLNEASEDEIRTFVLWATGVQGLPPGGIKIRETIIPGNLGCPYVHTCSCTIDLSPPGSVLSGRRAAYETKEGFIGYLKEAMVNTAYTDA